MRRAFFEYVATRTHTLLFLARWVARSSVGSRVARHLPGRHSLVAARPLRCRPGLSVGRRGSGRPPPGVLRWSFARRHRLGHVSQQRVDGTESRPHNRETLAAAGVQQEVPPVVPAHPRQPTPRLLGHLVCDSGKDHPAEKYVLNARSHKRSATTRSSGQTVCCCAVHKRADTAPFGLWVQTPQPVHDVTGVRDWSVATDQHAACSVGSGSGRTGPP